MPELKPYRGMSSRQFDTLEDPQQKAQAQRIASLAQGFVLPQKGMGGCLIFGSVFAFWICSFLVTGGGMFSASALGEESFLGIIFALGPCLMFPILIVGTVAILFFGGRAWDAFMERRIGKPAVYASSERLMRGEILDISYDQEINNPTEIQEIIFKLIMRETATYTSGTDRVTVTHDYPAGEVRRPGRTMQRGYRLSERADFEIPPDAMHTFVQRNNKLQWFFMVEVKIAKWPDYHQDYEILVIPEVAQ